jgi:outer membrane protein OmpA-like peptidoglycan-associated protein
MSQQRNNLPASEEIRSQLALQAIKQDMALSQRRAAAIYNVLEQHFNAIG